MRNNLLSADDFSFDPSCFDTYTRKSAKLLALKPFVSDYQYALHWCGWKRRTLSDDESENGAEIAIIVCEMILKVHSCSFLLLLLQTCQYINSNMQRRWADIACLKKKLLINLGTDTCDLSELIYCTFHVCTLIICKHLKILL